jgi:hypothetical protein
LIAGRWLNPATRTVGHQPDAARLAKRPQGGDVITLSINRQETGRLWALCRRTDHRSHAYTNNEYFAEATHQTGYAPQTPWW